MEISKKALAKLENGGIKQVAKKKAKKSVKKELRKVGLGKGMPGHAKALRSSVWFNCLMDPINCPGGKIPDDNVVPTFTAQLVTKIVLAGQTATSGPSGIGLYKVLGALVAGASNGYQTLGPIASSGNYSTAGTGGGTNAYSAPASLPAYQAARLVSAALYVSTLGSPNNTQGRIVLAFIPGPGTAISPAGTTWNATNLGQYATCIDLPAPKGFAMVRYMPSDPISLAFDTSQGTGYGQSRSPAASNLLTYGQFVALVDGMSSTALYNVEMILVENYELIPQQNVASMVGTSPSWSDPLELAVVKNVVAARPLLPIEQDDADTITGTPIKAGGSGSLGGVSPFANNPLQAAQPSTLEKVLGGVGSAIKWGTEMIPKVAPAVAAIAAAL